MLNSLPDTGDEAGQAAHRLLTLCTEMEMLQSQNTVSIKPSLAVEHKTNKRRDWEADIINLLRQGEKKACKLLAEQLINAYCAESSNTLEELRNICIDLFSKIYRDTNEEPYRFIKKLEEADDAGAIRDCVFQMIEHVSPYTFAFSGMNHVKALKNAEKYVNENITKKLRLKEISEAAGLSPAYFCMIFKKERGVSITNYLNILRIEKAKKLLRDLTIPLRQVSVQCGFKDQSWFTKVFKKYAGTSPGEYRKREGRISQ